MRRRPLRLLLAAAALAVTAVAAAATAAAAPSPAPARRLALGEAVSVEGTPLLCVALRSNGTSGIACMVWGKDAPRPGTYGVAIAVDGTVVLNQMLAAGMARTLLERTPQSAGGSARAAPRLGKVYRAVAGDSFGLPIDTRHILGCRVVDVKPTEAPPLYTGIEVACWRATDDYPTPSSDAVQLSVRMAAIVRFNARGMADRTVLVKKQPA